MKSLNLLFIQLLFFSFSFAQKEQATVLSNPLYLGYGLDMKGTENLILVPENRSNPESRLIAVHFMKLNAQEKTNLPPVFYFRGGPGEYTNPKEFYSYFTRSRHSDALAFEVKTLNQKRDVILVSQRGASGSKCFPIYQFKYRYYVGNQYEAYDFEKLGERKRVALQKTLKGYEDLDVDLAGYDILNMIEDIEDIRQHLGYQKIAMVGNSFGSQTALAYLEQYPKQVDRAILSAVEPVSHNYDDPDELWKLLETIETYALQDENIKADLPKIGLLEAFKVIVKRLKEAPKTIVLASPKGKLDTVVIGIDDFRKSMTYPYANGRKHRMETFPKYITELYREDYKMLAYAALNARDGYDSDDIMPILVNHSIGISTKRAEELLNKKSVEWLGNINYHLDQFQSIPSSKVVSDEFRQTKKTAVPILLIHGDLDRNTPLSNSHYLMQYLENGHLITVKNGTHGAKWSLFLKDKVFGKKILTFMNVDFEKTPFQSIKNQLPTSYELEGLEFMPIKGKSFYEMEMELEKD